MTDFRIEPKPPEAALAGREEKRGRTLRRIAWTVAVNVLMLGVLWLSYHSAGLNHFLNRTRIRMPGIPGEGTPVGFLLLFIPCVVVALLWFPKARNLSWEKGGDRWPRVMLAVVVLVQVTFTLVCTVAMHLHYALQ